MYTEVGCKCPYIFPISVYVSYAVNVVVILAAVVS